MEYKEFTLDPFQERSFELIDAKHSFIVSAPTGAGKTVIAEYAIEKALQENLQVIYTSPIKALSNQKFRDFCRNYGEKVGIMTGDITYNPEAPILIMTTEIFRNAIFEDGERFRNVLYLIFDEVHYLNDISRGTVWEESIIFAPSQIRVLCLSATIPNIEELASWIEKVRKQPVEIVYEEKRPVPLKEFCYVNQKGILNFKDASRYLPKKKKKNRNGDSYKKNGYEKKSASLDSFHEILRHLQRFEQIPCLYFLFSRKECEFHAMQCLNYQFLNPRDQKIVRKRLQDLSSRYDIKNIMDKRLGHLLRNGIAYHHAGMLPAMKEIVEQLFTDGFIKCLFATETFALGVNMPATSVIFNALKKYDGISVRKLKVLEYQQMSGRAGRRGIDEVGYVYTNLDNSDLLRSDLHSILRGPLEAVESQFNLSYSTLLNIYGRVGKEVVKTCDRSFGAFQRALLAQASGGKKQKRKVSLEQRRQLKNKLAFLSTLGYIDEKGLTSKGRFATFINGYEIQITELFFDGLFEECNEVILFVLLVAAVFEGKKGQSYSRVPKKIKTFVKEVEKSVKKCMQIESMYGIDEIKPLDFRLSAAAYAWAMGKSFRELSDYCSASPGDIIRTFRLAIQLCRQLRKVCQGYHEFTKKIDSCILAINRDELDALKQLQVFTNIEEKVK